MVFECKICEIKLAEVWNYDAQGVPDIMLEDRRKRKKGEARISRIIDLSQDRGVKELQMKSRSEEE